MDIMDSNINEGYDIISNLFYDPLTESIAFAAFLDLDDDPERIALARENNLTILPSRNHDKGHAVRLCDNIHEWAITEQLISDPHYFGRGYVRFLRITNALQARFLDAFELDPLLYKKIGILPIIRPQYKAYPIDTILSVNLLLQELDDHSKQFYGKHLLKSDIKFLKGMAYHW